MEEDEEKENKLEKLIETNEGAKLENGITLLLQQFIIFFQKLFPNKDRKFIVERREENNNLTIEIKSSKKKRKKPYVSYAPCVAISLMMPTIIFLICLLFFILLNFWES